MEYLPQHVLIRWVLEDQFEDADGFSAVGHRREHAGPVHSVLNFNRLGGERAAMRASRQRHPLGGLVTLSPHGSAAAGMAEPDERVAAEVRDEEGNLTRAQEARKTLAEDVGRGEVCRLASGASPADSDPSTMSTATSVPVTRDRVGEPARATLRAVGRRRLALDAVDRFRAADGFSHARALAFAFALTLLPSLITIVGLATALDQTTFTRVVRDVLVDLAPSAAGDVVTSALDQGAVGAHREHGSLALVLGGCATLVAGSTAFGQLERGANRIYGIERDRPSVPKYGLAAGLLVTAGAATTAAAVLLIAGSTLGRAAGWGDVYSVLRWPVIVGLVTATLALVFKLSPWRRQPEASWLIIGATFSAVLWLALTGVLAITLGTTADLGATYGPITGTIAVLLWTLFSALAILFGLAVAAQLEAVRAGVSGTRVDRHHNGAGASQATEPLS